MTEREDRYNYIGFMKCIVQSGYVSKFTITVTFTIILFLVVTLTKFPANYGNTQQFKADVVSSSDTKSPVFELNTRKFTSTKSCMDGHFKGPPAVCGGDGCLETLTGSPRPPPVLSTSTIANLEAMKGPSGKSIGLMHMRAIYLVTTMQWSFGIYGSVGEIGVYDGRLTALMAAYMETKVGERLFVCDIFGDVKHMKIFTNKAKKQVFEMNMRQVGYSLTHRSEEKKIRLWQDSSMYLSKAVLLQMGIPAFRLYSIDGNHHYPFVLNDIIHVVCVLRDGGIVVIDDVHEHQWHAVTGSIKQYMMFIDRNVIKPLMLVDRKLYLCTATWFTRYWNYLKANSIASKLQLCQVTNKRFAIKFTYLESCK